VGGVFAYVYNAHISHHLPPPPLPCRTQWPFFEQLIDLLDMVLSKAELDIASNYDHQLLPPLGSSLASDDTARQLRALGDDLRARCQSTAASLLAVSTHGELIASNTNLKRSLMFRNPYVDILNLIQASVLRRLRQSEVDCSASKSPACAKQERLLLDAVLVTMNGIAAGMRNTG
jgi:phosphoenolpyruvate carboxylase